MRLTKTDKNIISLLQGDLPVEERPFARLAEEAGISEDELLRRVESYLASGIMRRLGTILRHHKAGFNANAMCGWAVPAERVQEAGKLMATFRQASHVYERPTYPDWPYNLFTMLHGRSNEDLERAAREISNLTGITDYKLLYSTREFKKTSMKYF